MRIHNLKSANIKKDLRRRNKSLRGKLGAQELASAAKAAARNSLNLPGLLKAQHVLSYIPFGGELDPSKIEAQLSAHIYLPKITHFRLARMQFFPAASRRRVNHYGINEPCGDVAPFDVRKLDAVIMPLVAFNRNGDRLGQGAGFYDRAFAFRGFSSTSTRPLLIGLAYHFQEAPELVSEAWDIPLDAIITDQELIKLT